MSVAWAPLASQSCRPALGVGIVGGVGSGGLWWALVGSGELWWALVGSGGLWLVLVWSGELWWALVWRWRCLVPGGCSGGGAWWLVCLETPVGLLHDASTTME